ncbi:MAG: bifunctional 4-hydroxy-2-oxoglutarate aldolase/2-dehydro-3-deoxy-phosphogluconate aldolase [Muribaculaceae bacterium]|nr:bifunctional 4-hydroxy-2-oxoglutarate aldolase/2-dehydro-3-deoxy-phosphogluconate aldolase [Muribaculaceae bacterium]
MKINLLEKLRENKVLPIIRSSNPEEVVGIVNALIDGGLDMMEVNVENPRIFDAIAKVSDNAIICAGGIITSIQAQAVMDCGAQVISSPIFQESLLKISKDKQLPFIAGTSTANEAYNAWKSRIPVVKIYPISAMGGVSYIENLLRPMPFLNVIPQGNVALSEVRSYIDAGALAVGVGRNLTKGASYSEITKCAKDLLEQLNNG